jgi:hypothetical protein
MREKVLLVSSSTEGNVARALLILKSRVFPESRLDLLCSVSALPFFEGRSEVHQIMVFPPRRRLAMILKLLGRIWRSRYDVVAVLWCLDVGKLRPKIFALFCGCRRVLVFNENLDCSYLTPRFLKTLVARRAHDGTLTANSLMTAVLVPLKDGYWGLLRLLLFPIRLFILLILVLGLYLAKPWRH